MTHECKCTWSSPSGKPSDGWCTVGSSYYRALLLLLKWLTPSFFFLSPPKITVLSYRPVEFSSKTLPPLPHSLRGTREGLRVFPVVLLYEVSVTRLSRENERTLDLHTPTSPCRRDPKVWQILILSFYNLMYKSQRHTCLILGCLFVSSLYFDPPENRKGKATYDVLRAPWFACITYCSRNVLRSCRKFMY